MVSYFHARDPEKFSKGGGSDGYLFCPPPPPPDPRMILLFFTIQMATCVYKNITDRVSADQVLKNFVINLHLNCIFRVYAWSLLQSASREMTVQQSLTGIAGNKTDTASTTCVSVAGRQPCFRTKLYVIILRIQLILPVKVCHYNTCNSALNLVFVHVKIRQNLVRRGYMYIEYIFNRTILIVHVHVLLHKYKKQIMNFILWNEICDQKNRQSNVVNKLLAIDMAQC